MSKYHQLTIEEVKKETPDCVVISFKIPSHLKKEFAFKQGQYLTLKAKINSEEIVRSYSLCTAPYEEKWSVAIKKIKGGKFSTFANTSLKVGDTLEVMPPDGKFFVKIAPDQKNKYAAFAAGSGITPIISIIKTHLKEEPQCQFTLFYLNKDSQSVIFKQVLDALKQAFKERFNVYYFYTQQKTENKRFEGRFSAQKVKQLNEEVLQFNQINQVFLCGPQEMIFLLKDELQKIGLPEKNIHFELFEAVTPPEAKKEKVAAIESEVTIIVDDEEITFTVPKGKNILEIAEQEDADVPYSCKGGVCCTCKAKLLEGSVEMLVNYGLDEEDIKNNLVLTCQAVPTSKKVVVDYDDIY